LIVEVGVVWRFILVAFVRIVHFAAEYFPCWMSLYRVMASLYDVSAWFAISITIGPKHAQAFSV
jgi:hypothetical protein